MDHGFVPAVQFRFCVLCFFCGPCTVYCFVFLFRVSELLVAIESRTTGRGSSEV